MHSMMALIAPLAMADGAAGQLVAAKPGLWIWTFVIFGLLCVVLWKYGWGSMIAALDRRDQAIRGAVEDAKYERREAERLLTEAKELVAKARREAADAVATAQTEATKEKQKIADSAREEYDRIVARGREQIASETKAALAQVRSTVAELALDVASKLVQRSMDTPTQRELAERFVTELESARKKHPSA
jgi:F-type H+-transporting ATPase subunit b